MKDGICYIVGAGENYGLDFSPRAGDYVIAADGGLSYLEKAGIAADLVIGDFDTLCCTPMHPNVIRLNPQKDETDMMAAVWQGIKLGYTEFHIWCGTGGRVDHFLANIQTLAWLAERGLRGFLFGENSVLTVIKDSEYCFDSSCAGYVSVFSLSDKSSGVYLEHLKYELHDAELSNRFPLGVSNEFTGSEARVRVEKGILLLVFPRKERQQ